ncbi:MAG: hypothetical protein M3N13_00990 [Candidatus Eremiobacteraeota bacterium]|nr:hypothetical protein [Candidatus Eremiobacteraeota bacterium]
MPVPLGSAPTVGIKQAINGQPSALSTPALISVNRSTNALEFWPISAHGGKDPQAFAQHLGLSGADAMAARGTTLYIANSGSQSIVSYDVVTKHETTLPDTLGLPLDIAVGKDASVYVANDGKPSNVAMYPPGSTQPIELICPLMSFVDGVAVNNEGDILVNGWASGGFPSGIFEIPNGPRGPEPKKCFLLHLKYGSGAVAGYAINPKTDDLVVLDNPSQCAGGAEGRMTIYPRPYIRTNGVSRILGGNCTGGLWINADSTLVYYGDSDVSGSFNFIRTAQFPNGKSSGTYSGGASGPFATIPNTLPN